MSLIDMLGTNIFEIFLLFWALPSLIMLLICIEAHRLDSTAPDQIYSSDWSTIIIISIFWPMGVFFAVAGLILWIFEQIGKCIPNLNLTDHLFKELSMKRVVSLAEKQLIQDAKDAVKTAILGIIIGFSLAAVVFQAL